MGALDRLLEEAWLCIDGISGTSAGAMNAAALVDSDQAIRQRLERLDLAGQGSALMQFAHRLAPCHLRQIVG